MNVLDMTIIRLAAGLVLLIAANIALGSINAIIDGEWDQTKFRNGCIKSAVVAAALVAVYFAGYLNPDLMVVEVDGQTVNLMTAVSLAMLAAFTAYAVDVLKKLKDMLSTATPSASLQAGSNSPPCFQRGELQLRDRRRRPRRYVCRGEKPILVFLQQRKRPAGGNY